MKSIRLFNINVEDRIKQHIQHAGSHQLQEIALLFLIESSERGQAYEVDGLRVFIRDFRIDDFEISPIKMKPLKQSLLLLTSSVYRNIE